MRLLSVFGTNIFSAFYQMFNGEMTIDMDKEDVVELLTTTDDQYSILFQNSKIICKRI